MPQYALFFCPDVNILLHPISIISSKATFGFLHMSKARWKVMFNPSASLISLLLAFVSISPCFVRQPITTPSTPALRDASISRSIISISVSLYRKSPPRGRIMTCNFVVVNNFLAIRISPKDGVVPPSGIPAHNSTLFAPPSCALNALMALLAHISI